MKERNMLTLLTHSASSSGRALAAKFSPVFLARPTVEAGVGVTGPLWLVVVKPAPDMAGGGCGRRRGCCCCCGGSGGGGGKWCGDWCWGCGGSPGVVGPASGVWWTAGYVRRGWGRTGSGGGGRGGCGDWSCGGGGCGEVGDGGHRENSRKRKVTCLRLEISYSRPVKTWWNTSWIT